MILRCAGAAFYPYFGANSRTVDRMSFVDDTIVFLVELYAEISYSREKFETFENGGKCMNYKFMVF